MILYLYALAGYFRRWVGKYKKAVKPFKIIFVFVRACILSAVMLGILYLSIP